jgi:hypothetical protein
MLELVQEHGITLMMEEPHSLETFSLLMEEIGVVMAELVEVELLIIIKIRYMVEVELDHMEVEAEEQLEIVFIIKIVLLIMLDPEDMVVNGVEAEVVDGWKVSADMIIPCGIGKDIKPVLVELEDGLIITELGCNPV